MEIRIHLFMGLHFVRSLVVALLLCGSTLPGFSAGLEKAEEPTPEEIIQRFSEKESEFQDVWGQYTYTQKIIFQVLDRSHDVQEQREMVIEVYFTTDGERKSRVVSDQGRLQSVGVSDEDISDAMGLQPFVLTKEDLPKYKVKFLGAETVDELGTYVFEVKPKKKKKGERYFQGKIWVDDLDFQIVMSEGKAVPDYRDNKFPKFETIREQIDGSYWFPTWTKAEDTLRFGNFTTGYRDVHVRQYILYEDFKRFEVDTTIRYEPEKVPEG
jgi:outer membrane lipoprotein-sorting protein